MWMKTQEHLSCSQTWKKKKKIHVPRDTRLLHSLSVIDLSWLEESVVMSQEEEGNG